MGEIDKDTMPDANFEAQGVQHADGITHPVWKSVRAFMDEAIDVPITLPARVNLD